MISTENIISTALLGTANRKIYPEDFPDFLRSQLPFLSDNSSICYEDRFLQAASITFAAANAGMEPAEALPGEILAESNPEILRYCSDTQASFMLYLLRNGHTYILNFAMSFLRKKGLILPPFALPVFVREAYLAGGKYMYQTRFAVWPILGNRGKWLVSALGYDSAKFQDVAHSTRLKMFVAMRKASFRDSARQLDFIWGEISDKQKKEFLSVFLAVWDNDLDFLWGVFNNPQESADIRKTALQLLLRNPNSVPVKTFMQVLGESFSIDGRRHCDFKDIELSQQLKDFGISTTILKTENLPAFLNKLSDTEIVVFRLINSVPLQFWTNALGLDSAKAAAFLQQNPAFKLGFDFRNVIIKFRDSEWAEHYCMYYSRLFKNLFPLLDVDQLERLSEYVDFDDDFAINEKICGAIDNYDIWGKGFSEAVLHYMIRSRNFENTLPTAQFLAVKLHESADFTMSSYIQEHSGNDIVTAFFLRVRKLRGNLRRFIS